MAKNPKKPVKIAARARDKGTVRLIGAEVDPQLDDALEELMRRERRTKKVLIVIALEELLSKYKLWPPQPGEET